MSAFTCVCVCAPDGLNWSQSSYLWERKRAAGAVRWPAPAGSAKHWGWTGSSLRCSSQVLVSLVGAGGRRGGTPSHRKHTHTHTQQKHRRLELDTSTNQYWYLYMLFVYAQHNKVTRKLAVTITRTMRNYTIARHQQHIKENSVITAIILTLHCSCSSNKCTINLELLLVFINDKYLL